jgi:hypothetical protein
VLLQQCNDSQKGRQPKPTRVCCSGGDRVKFSAGWGIFVSPSGLWLTYTIGVSRALGGGLLQGDEALKATVDKAGEHCHAKGQKLSNARAVDNRIIFRCVSGEPKPQ